MVSRVQFAYLFRIEWINAPNDVNTAIIKTIV